jgi:hypothetical protein
VKGARWFGPVVACAWGTNVLLGVQVAAADLSGESSCGAGPWVSVNFAGGPWSPDFERSVMGDLDAGLEARGLSACPEPASSGRPPSAVVTISGNPRSDVALVVEVSDAVTKKRVSRDVDLKKVPSDGRAFAVALAIDELVWATWAELALEPAEAKRREAPREVVEAVERELPSQQASARIGARFGVEHFPGQLTQLGGDAVLLAGLSTRTFLEFALVLRQGLSTDAEHGAVRSRSLGVLSGLRLEAISGESFDLDVGLGARAALFQFQGRAEPGALATDFTGIGVDVRGMLDGRLLLSGPLSLEIGAGLGWPLRTVHAQDEGQDASSVQGPELLGTLGLLVDL